MWDCHKWTQTKSCQTIPNRTHFIGRRFVFVRSIDQIFDTQLWQEKLKPTLKILNIVKLSWDCPWTRRWWLCCLEFFSTQFAACSLMVEADFWEWFQIIFHITLGTTDESYDLGFEGECGNGSSCVLWNARSSERICHWRCFLMKRTKGKSESHKLV